MTYPFSVVTSGLEKRKGINFRLVKGNFVRKYFVKKNEGWNSLRKS